MRYSWTSRGSSENSERDLPWSGFARGGEFMTALGMVLAIDVAPTNVE